MRRRQHRPRHLRAKGLPQQPHLGEAMPLEGIPHGFGILLQRPGRRAWISDFNQPDPAAQRFSKPAHESPISMHPRQIHQRGLCSRPVHAQLDRFAFFRCHGRPECPREVPLGKDQAPADLPNLCSVHRSEGRKKPELRPVLRSLTAEGGRPKSENRPLIQRGQTAARRKSQFLCAAFNLGHARRCSPAMGGWAE